MKYITMAILLTTFNLSANEKKPEYYPACGYRVYECLGSSDLLDKETVIRNGFKYSTWRCENKAINAVTGLCQHLIQLPTIKETKSENEDE